MNCNTGYKVPDRGGDLPCKHQGRSFHGRQLEAQVDKLVSEFQLEDEWIAAIMEYHLGESDLKSALRTRNSIQERVKRAEDLYIYGELDRRKYSRIKREAEA